MRIVLALLLVVHGALHFIGVVGVGGLTGVGELQMPTTSGDGAAWLTAGLLLLASGVAVFAAPRHWWISALPGIVSSQWLIMGAWQDARWGTVANLFIALPLVVAAAEARRGSLRSRYARDAAGVRGGATDGARPVVTDDDLHRSTMPELVQRYLRSAGVVGKPRVRWFEARMHGRIRGGPDEPWMTARVTQVSRIAPAVRLYFMDAVRAHLPARVYHRYAEGAATMEARILGLVPVVDASGPVLHRSETVTVLNDVFLLAPAALLDLELEWQELDHERVAVTWCNEGERVSAEVTFDEAGRLVDFASDDRALWRGADTEPAVARWSTPIRRYGDFGGRTQPAEAVARWSAGNGPWIYAEFTIDEVRVNGGSSDPAPAPSARPFEAVRQRWSGSRP